MVAEDYVHRIGRTGRAGAEGLAISLVSRDEESRLREIRRMLKQDIAIEAIAGFEPSQPLRLDGPSSSNPSRASQPRHAHRPHAHSNGNGRANTSGDGAHAAKNRKRGPKRHRAAQA
jgi:ATP-dependent RNA helicase RhlE